MSLDGHEDWVRDVHFTSEGKIMTLSTGCRLLMIRRCDLVIHLVGPYIHTFLLTSTLIVPLLPSLTSTLVIPLLPSLTSTLIVPLLPSLTSTLIIPLLPSLSLPLRITKYYIHYYALTRYGIFFLKCTCLFNSI